MNNLYFYDAIQVLALHLLALWQYNVCFLLKWALCLRNTKLKFSTDAEYCFITRYHSYSRYSQLPMINCSGSCPFRFPGLNLWLGSARSVGRLRPRPRSTLAMAKLPMRATSFTPSVGDSRYPYRVERSVSYFFTLAVDLPDLTPFSFRVTLSPSID